MIKTVENSNLALFNGRIDVDIGWLAYKTQPCGL